MDYDTGKLLEEMTTAIQANNTKLDELLEAAYPEKYKKKTEQKTE